MRAKQNNCPRQISLLVLLLMLGVSLAHAQATRTWVSGVGDDANPCSRTAPCKTFAGAISKTATGGEISVLDPGGYGAVTITKSITLDGAGTLASILAAGTNGIIINDVTNAAKVIIRNISINGVGSGINGIRFLAGNQLTVENVVIDGFTTHGIDVSLASGGKVFVKDTNITKCGSGGMRVTTVGGLVTSFLDNVHSEANDNGFQAGAGNSVTTINNSSLVGNISSGVVANGSTVIINVENSTIASNATGVNTNNFSSLIRISNNAIYNNGQGVRVFAGATVASDGTNRVSGNTSSDVPNSTIIRQ